jgi:hypothetical protein
MKVFKFLIMSVVLVALASCSTNSSSTTAGRNVSFLVTDAPAWYNFKAVNVEITGIDYQLAGDSTWQTLTPFSAGVYDLKALSNGFFRQLGQIQLPNIALIKNIRLTIGTNNNVVLADNTVKSLSVWNNQNSVLLHINQEHATASGDSIMVDFNLARSIVYSHNGYILKPVLRGFVTNETASLDGFITPDTLNCKLAYKIFIIYNGDTITTASDAQNHNHFKLWGFPKGAYTVQIVPINDTTTTNTFNITINMNGDGIFKFGDLAGTDGGKELENNLWNKFFNH